MGYFPTRFVPSPSLLLGCMVLILPIRVRYDGERALSLHESRIQIPTLSSNNVEGRPTQVTPLHPLVVPPTIHVLHIQTGLFPGRGPPALRHVSPGRRRFLQVVRQLVLHRHPVLHRYLPQRNQNYPTHLFSLGAWRRLDQLGTAIVDLIWCCIGTELG